MGEDEGEVEGFDDLDEMDEMEDGDPFAELADMRGDFIESIYNYCDRWCEECAFTKRCFLFAQEQRAMERHILRGEDPGDPAVAMQDMTDSLKLAMRMVAHIAREQGIDLNALPPSRSRRRKHRNEHPLNQRANRWLDRVGALLAQVRRDIAAVAESRDAQALAGWLPPDARDAERMVEALTDLRDGADLLSRYRFLVPVKIARALSGIGEGDDPDDDGPDPDGYMRLDSLRTVRLVIACLERAEAALWAVSELRDSWRDPALSLVVETQALRRAVGEHFRGWEDVRRPGFDAG